MAALSLPVSSVRLAPAAARLPRPSIETLLAGSLGLLYLAVGVVVSLQHHLLVGDAWSRVGNAYYVLFSRDPHLAAVGFVWNPLPSLLTMPLLLLKDLWPPLVEVGFAGIVVSVLAMALAAREMWRLLDDIGLDGSARLGLVLVFGLHPMIVSYGSNGDSEALFILCLLVATRHLVRWISTESLAALVTAAVALAAAYLVRYEAGAVAIGVGALVFLWTWSRVAGTRRHRLEAGLADVAVALVPFVLAFALWSIASWIVVGNPFEQFTSIYGTAAQLAEDHDNIFFGTGQGTPAAVEYMVRQIVGLEPAVAIIVAAAAVAATWRRDPRILAPLAVFGPVLLFAAIAWLTGRTGGWLRYYITVVPFAVVCAGIALATVRGRTTGRPGDGATRVPTLRRSAMTTRMGGGIASVLAVLLLGTALPSSIGTMFDPALGRGDANRIGDLRQYLAGEEVAAYLDALPDTEVPPGSVLVDTFIGFPIVLQSRKPARFVITSDRDFRMHLADPATTEVRYVLVPPIAGLAGLDAVNRQWPGMYANGAGVATLVQTFAPPLPGIPGGEAYQWRLYRILRTR
jgi:hypothetical protein